MLFGLNLLTTFLNHFGTRKVLSSPDGTQIYNIFARRNPRVARSRAARLHAAKSAARLRNQRSIANAAADRKNQPYSTAGTGTTQGAKQRGNKYRRARMSPLTARKPLQRCSIVLAPQPPTHPQPPGAFIAEPSFIVPGFPGLDYRHLPPFIEQKIFSDALAEGRQVILRAEEERKVRDEEAKFAHLLEQDSNKADAARRRAEDAEFARLLEEDLRKAEAAHHRAEREEFARLLEEDMRKAKEAHRRALEQEERQRQAERKAMERERREQEHRERRERECREQERRERRERERREQERERREQERERRWREHEQERERRWRERRKQERERLERECREQERRERAATHSDLRTRLRVYEEKWAALRGNAVGVDNLSFYEIPWPSLENVWSVRDITEDRVLAFLNHPLQEHIGEGQVKSVRSEILRWHPDKFNVKVLVKVIESDREAVKEAAGRVARILTTIGTKMR